MLSMLIVKGKRQKIADSNISRSTIPESFSNLTSFRAALSGQTGSTIEKVENTKMLVAYHPVKKFHNTWVVLLMQSSPP